MKLAKKITTKQICGSVKNLVMATVKDQITDQGVPDGLRVDLYTVYGSASGYKIKETDLGESMLLTGAFEAVDTKGNKTRSGNLYLPGSAAELISGLLSTSTGVEFALKISAVTDQSSATGYVYDVETLMKADESDSLARIANQAGLSLPAPAPKAEPAPAEVKETGKKK